METEYKKYYEYINAILQIINILPNDERQFIKDNIILKDEPGPEAYQEVIEESPIDWGSIRAEYAKEYGWTTIRDIKTWDKKRIVGEIEGVPKGYKVVGNKRNEHFK